MILQPILQWWILLAIFIPFIGFSMWCIITFRHKRSEKYLWIRRLITVILILLISLRPSLPGASKSTGNALLDVYFVIDTTTSMTAEDYNGSDQRIEGVRQDVKDITKELIGARFSVVTFSNQATTQLPLTSDTSALTTTIDTMSTQEVFYGTGSSIDMPVDYLKDELKRIKNLNPERGRLIFYMSDGEQTVDSAPESFEPLEPYISGGAVLGYGTLSGGKMQAWRLNDSDPITYIKDPSGDTYPQPDALSKLDEDNLETIAYQLNTQYSQRTKPGEIQQITKDINVGEIIEGSRDSESFNDIYWVISVPLVIMISYEARRQFHMSKALHRARKSGDIS